MIACLFDVSSLPLGVRPDPMPGSTHSMWKSSDASETASEIASATKCETKGEATADSRSLGRMANGSPSGPGADGMPSGRVVREEPRTYDRPARSPAEESGSPSGSSTRHLSSGRLPGAADGKAWPGEGDGYNPGVTRAAEPNPEPTLREIRVSVARSHDRMCVLTHRLLTLGPHRLSEFKAAKAVRDDLKRLRKRLQKQRPSDQ